MSVIDKIKKDKQKEIITPKKMGLLVENPVYKPFRYPWCYDAWLTQQRIHWLPEEVPLGDDVRDWQKNLSQSEKNLLTQIFRFFTQADVEVQNCYLRHYTTVFKPTEVLMMMTAFASMETVHIAAYSHLLDTIGMPESEYSAFMKYKEMKDKYDYMQGFNVNSKKDIAKTVAVFSAFTEGLQLFASFAILLNFPRFNKMKGMGQIVTWSVRDETLHCNSMIRLFKEFIKENPNVVEDRLKQVIDTNSDVFLNVFHIYAETEMSPWLHKIKVPCLVLTGEHDGGCSPRLNQLIHNALPQSELVILPEYKHSILLEDGVSVAQNIVRFISNLEK